MRYLSILVIFLSGCAIVDRATIKTEAERDAILHTEGNAFHAEPDTVHLVGTTAPDTVHITTSLATDSIHTPVSISSNGNFYTYIGNHGQPYVTFNTKFYVIGKKDMINLSAVSHLADKAEQLLDKVGQAVDKTTQTAKKDTDTVVYSIVIGLAVFVILMCICAIWYIRCMHKKYGINLSK